MSSITIAHELSQVSPVVKPLSFSPTFSLAGDFKHIVVLHVSLFGGVFFLWECPNSWMVDNRKSHLEMDGLGLPPFWEISI